MAESIHYALEKGWSTVDYRHIQRIVSSLTSIHLEGNEHCDEEVSSLGLLFGNVFTIYPIFSVNDTKLSYIIYVLF